MKILKKLASVCLSAAVLAGCVAGCGGSGAKKTAEPTKPSTRVITDIAGNQVTVPATVKKIAITPLPWASIVYTIDGSSERIGAIHPGAMSAYKGRFLETKDKHFGTLNTKLVNQNFTVNMEGLANEGIDSVIMWKYQQKDADKLKEVKVPALLIYNDTVDNLKKSFMIVGQLLGKEQRAKQICEYYDDAYKKIGAHKAEVEKAKKPTILFIKNAKLRLQGNDNFMHQAIEMGGGHNPISQSSLDSNNKNISMEEVYKMNPDIIFLSNFDKFVPDDLYNNKIAGQDWSSVKAVKDRRVYKVPMGIYRWDAPGVETPLMMKWFAHVLQPEIFKDIDVRADAKKFYKDFMNYELTDKDLSVIFADEANKNSKPLF